MSGDVVMSDRFDEWVLLADVIEVWGPAGAHADLVRWMIDEIGRLRAMVPEEGIDSGADL